MHPWRQAPELVCSTNRCHAAAFLDRANSEQRAVDDSKHHSSPAPSGESGTRDGQRTAASTGQQPSTPSTRNTNHHTQTPQTPQHHKHLLSCNGCRFHSRTASRCYPSGTCIRESPKQCLRCYPRRCAVTLSVSPSDTPQSGRLDRHDREQIICARNPFLTSSWATSRPCSPPTPTSRRGASPCRRAQYGSPEAGHRMAPASSPLSAAASTTTS